MKKLLTAIFVISITVPAFALTVTGTILDGDPQEPLYTATVQQVDNPQNGTTADESGAFSITVPDANTELTFRYMGMKTKNITAAQANGNTIIMETDTEMLKDILITSCTTNSVANAKSILYNNATEKCVPTECESARYKLTGQTTATKINQNSCTTDSADQCENDDTSCTTITIGDACVDQVGTDCTDQAGNHVRTAKYEWDGKNLNCVVTKCKDHFMLQNGTCVASDGPCTAPQIAAIEHATKGELKKGKCHVTECESGYEVSKDTCVAIGGNCKSLPANAKSGNRQWDKTQNQEICIVTACRDGYKISADNLSCTEIPQPKLSEADSQARISELRENAQKMRDKEQSTENKLISATGIGATGIGASQALSALSEQRADDRAEDDMRAYLATIKCDYGMGKNISGGETGIELPGGNELAQYVTQYKTLAADLKVRKTALGLAPGIESETIIDAADTGLYDNAATGKTDGAFTSLSRALSDETSADAAAWAKQKADTASKLKTGATVAGIGAVGSAIANLAVNSGDAKKNKSDEILAKYAPLYKLERAIASLSTTPIPACPTNGATGTYPECVCNNAESIYNQNTNTCDQSITNSTQNSNAEINNESPKKEENTSTQQTAPEVSASSALSNAITKTINDQKTNTATIRLPAVKLFDIGKYDLTSDAQTALAQFGTALNDTAWNKCTVDIVGYTDPIGGTKINKKLSQNRANAVKNAINTSNKTIVVHTDGKSNCTCGAGDIPSGQENAPDYKQCKNQSASKQITTGRYAPCRRVEITLSCGENNSATSGNILEMSKSLTAAAENLASI
mgnify:CR=1 FL=1